MKKLPWTCGDLAIGRRLDANPDPTHQPPSPGGEAA